MKPSLKKYLEYADSEEEFTYRVRMESTWDDQAYQTFIENVMRVIDDYKEANLLPIPIVLLFTSGLNHLIGMISNPLFLANTSKPYQELVQTGCEELLELQKKFFSGELFMKQ